MFKGRFEKVFFVTFFVTALFVASSALQPASAERYTSPNFIIDGSAGASFGDQSGSTNYGLVSTGGESIVGNGASGSYKLTSGYSATLEKSLQLAVQPSGLVAYYPLDEAAGSAVYDNSLNGNNGNFINAPIWTTGKLAGALQFTGAGDARSVAIPDSVSLSPSTAVTVSAWFRPATTTAVDRGVVMKDESSGVGNAPYEIVQTGGGKISFRINSPGNVTAITTSTTTVVAATWYYATGTYDGTTMRLYINGNLESSAAQSSIADSTGNLNIGRQKASQPTRHFDGIIDHVKIFNRGLTANEVKAEYDAQNSGVPTGITLNTITSGISNSTDLDAIVQTDAAAYNLTISQDHDLQNGANFISPVSGSIASPVTWSEGTTKGLGFSLVSATGTAVPGKWSAGSAYAALPGSGTSFYDRTGTNSLAKDVLGMRLRIDVPSSQVAGAYVNNATITGVVKP